jgi:cholesterol oxidase
VYDHPASPIVIENLAHRAPASFADSPLTANLRKLNFTIALGIPQGVGQFEYQPGDDSVLLQWPQDADANVLQAFKSAFYTLAPPGKGILLDNAQDGTVHPLGGMPLGLATDLHCRVKNYPGLYAIDGSILPGPGALTNPSLLITAMAERCMAALQQEMICRYNGC